MKRPLVLTAALLILGGLGAMSLTAIPSVSAQTAAAQVATARSTTFDIRNMTCALCPVTVKKAMERVAGVKSVRIDFDARTATVVFDPAVTSVDAIAAASANAGYPAAVKS